MQAETAQDILITGLPRLGTTLTCHLLNKVSECVALHEPMAPAQLKGLDADALLAAIGQFLTDQRAQILAKGATQSKSWNGTVPANPRADANQHGQRTTRPAGRSMTGPTSRRCCDRARNVDFHSEATRVGA